jgi:hypothetical protein
VNAVVAHARVDLPVQKAQEGAQKQEGQEQVQGKAQVS